MPSATASGADTGSGGAARSREHNQGNQARSFTPDQQAAVIRIRKCSAMAFYDILGLESVKTTCTETDIKKAYRKQSLLTHPDKNGHEHADEAFKMVSRAFGILGDKEKREKFDRYGTDPDSRFASAQAQNPFSGFAQRQASGGRAGRPGGMWEEAEMTPEEMFARFFGGGGFGGGGGGFGGQQFVFNFGGGPGIRVHQFGGATPRRRPREGAQGQQPEQSSFQALMSLLPMLLLFIVPLISSLFSGSSSPAAGVSWNYDSAEPPLTQQRSTPNHDLKFFVNPTEIQSYSEAKLAQLDLRVEQDIVRKWTIECENELAFQQRMFDRAQGFIFQDPVAMKAAKEYEAKSCKKLEKIGVRRARR